MFGINSKKIAALVVAIIGAFTIGGCGKTVYITYQPLKLGNKLWISPQNNQVNAGPNRLWMVYCISKIKNKGNNAVDFNFQPADFYIESGQPLMVGQAISSWAWTVQDKVVSKNTTEYDLGTIVFSVEVANVNQPSWVNLHYKTTSGESVSMVKHVTAPPDPVLNNSLSQFSLPQTCVQGTNIPD